MKRSRRRSTKAIKHIPALRLHPPHLPHQQAPQLLRPQPQPLVRPQYHQHLHRQLKSLRLITLRPSRSNLQKTPHDAQIQYTKITMKYLLPFLLLAFSCCSSQNRFLEPFVASDPVLSENSELITAAVHLQESPFVASPDNSVWRIFGLLIALVFLLCFLSNYLLIKQRLIVIWNYVMHKYKPAPKSPPKNVSLGDLQAKK